MALLAVLGLGRCRRQGGPSTKLGVGVGGDPSTKLDVGVGVGVGVGVEQPRDRPSVENCSQLEV